MPETSLTENIVPAIESVRENSCPLLPDQLVVAVLPALYTLSVIEALSNTSAPVNLIVGFWPAAAPVLGVITIFLSIKAIELSCYFSVFM
jgi:hypothetical protein